MPGDIVLLASGDKVPLGDASALLAGILAVLALQSLFSQWSVMNFLFATTPLNAAQWFSSLLISLSMIPVALLANKLDPRS